MTVTETLDPIRITSDRMSNFDENLLAFYVFLADLIGYRTAVEAFDLNQTNFEDYMNKHRENL